ncbi:MAG TPA: hypothetical protein VD967_01455 [Candidatus Paceibacterota bacterium]|nr:hypothetical protein [Candidatus Paceibacterota bacterium]
MAGSIGAALLLVVGASFLSKEPAEGKLTAVSGTTSEASANLTELIKERIAAQKAAAPTEDWQAEFNSLISKPLNPATDLSSSTLTDLLARSLFTEFTKNQNGGELDAAGEQRIISETLGKITLRFTTYSAGNLSLSEDSSAAAIRQYGNELGAIVADNSSENINEAAILSQALDRSDRAALAALAPISTSYHNLLSYSLRVRVPREALDEHLAFVNALSAMGDTVEAMRVAFNDPVRTVLYLEKYQQSAEALAASVLGLKQLFDQKGVAFAQNEPGSLLISIAKSF